MRLLMLSKDVNILKSGTDAASRFDANRKAVGEIEPLIITKKNYIKSFFFEPKIVPDLITSQDPFEVGLLGIFLSWRFSIPIEIQVHTDIASPYFARLSFFNFMRVRLAKFVLSHASCVRTVSEAIKKNLKLDFPINVLPVFRSADLNNGEIFTGSSLKERYPQFKIIGLYTGRFTAEKNIPLAITAFYEATKGRHDVGLILLGNGADREKIRALVKKLQIEDRVICEPWTDDPASYYLGADFFLCTSWYEGYGVSLLEAGLAELPIISSRVGIIGSLLPEELVQSFEPGNLFDASLEIKKFLANQSFYKTNARILAPRLKSRMPMRAQYDSSLLHSLNSCTLRKKNV